MFRNLFRNMTLHKVLGMVTCIILIMVIGAHNSEEPKGTTDFIYVYTALFISIALWAISYLYYTKCKKCGKLGTMKIFKKEVVDEKSSRIKKTLHHNSGGQKQSEQVLVPATMYTYHWHRRCKECGHEDYVVREKKKEN